MSVIPSIILSAVLSCGSALPANAQQAIRDIQSGNCAGDTYYENICNLRDILCNSGIDVFVNGSKCSLDEIFSSYFGCENGNPSDNQTAPSPEATPEPSAPEVTPEPSTPEATPAPEQSAPTRTPEAFRPTAPPTQAPVVTPTEPPTVNPTQAPSGDSAYAYRVIELVNQERAKYGLSALSADETLMRAAQKRAIETVTSFSHTRPNGSSFSSVLSEFGVSYRSAGENIAYGQRTPEEVVNAWMNSSGHRANILNGSYTKIGVGCYKSGSTYYWSQLFTG